MGALDSMAKALGKLGELIKLSDKCSNIKLEQRNKKSLVMEVSIKCPTDCKQVLLINMNKINHPSGMNNTTWNKLCDYLLISEWENDCLAVVLIELKKSYSDSNELKGMEQLVRSMPLLSYLQTGCEIESKTTLNFPISSTKYALLIEGFGTRLDKPHLKLRRSSQQEKRVIKRRHKGKTIRIIIDNFFHIKELIGN